MPRLDPPEDKSITTLYIGGLGENVTDSELRSERFRNNVTVSLSVFELSIQKLLMYNSDIEQCYFSSIYILLIFCFIFIFSVLF